MNISICCPTRGLLFTEVLESVVRIGKKHEIKIHASHNIPVPRAFNYLVEEALKDKYPFIYFIEEDTVPISEITDEMIRYFADPTVGAVCVNYPLHNGQGTVVRHQDTSDLMYCGLGSTMVRADLFYKIPQPWFRSDKAFYFTPFREWKDVDPEKQYGLYDVYFFCMLRHMGYQLIQMPGMAKHLRIDKLGNSQYNQGLHEISVKSPYCHPSLVPMDPSVYLK